MNQRNGSGLLGILTLASTDSTPNAYRFTGERFSRALGLSYLRARWYNPGTGRFLTRDTYAGDPVVPPSLHKYLYAHADPVNQTDPSGHQVVALGIKQQQVDLRAIPWLIAVGVSAACVYRLTRSFFRVFMLMHIFGGTYTFDANTPPCEAEWVPCDKLKIPKTVMPILKNYPPWSGKCVDCANQVEKRLRAAGFTDVSVIALGYNLPAAQQINVKHPTRGKVCLSVNNYHEVVKVNDCFIDSVVYENYGPRAVTWDEYRNLWEYPDDIEEKPRTGRP